ncbi:MAG: class I SAM-dependent rRNA methyltransferase [Planctomycetota bacterium]
MARKLFLKSGCEKLRSGHPWVYRDADVRALGGVPMAAVIDVHDAADRAFIGRGLYDADSAIAIRLFTWNDDQPVDLDLVQRRLCSAFALRERFLDLGHTTAYRLVNGEGDDLPGLVIDRYQAFAVVQPYSAVWLPWLRDIAEITCQSLGLRGAVLKNRIRQVQDAVRRANLEGLLHGEPIPDSLVIQEHALAFVAAVGAGQKTGLFLDQRDNRLATARLCRDQRVLNLFAYTGGFSIHAAAHGARSVTSVDVARGCEPYALQNLQLNQLDAARHEFIVADAFAYLARHSGAAFDVVILDPPTFATTKKQVFTATKGYERLIEAAARVTRASGVLVCCSCTAQVGAALFMEIAARATARAGRSYRLLEVRGLPHDHPTRAALPESRYLKCLIGVLE